MRKQIVLFAASLLIPASAWAGLGAGAAEQLYEQVGAEPEAMPAAPSVETRSVRHNNLSTYPGFVCALISAGLVDKATAQRNLQAYLFRTENFIALAKAKRMRPNVKKAMLKGVIVGAYATLLKQTKAELPSFMSSYAGNLISPLKSTFDDAMAFADQGRFDEAAQKAETFKAGLQEVQNEVSGS